jgi:hypothetical protein
MRLRVFLAGFTRDAAGNPVSLSCTAGCLRLIQF